MSCGIELLTSYELTQIGAVLLLNDHSTDNLSFHLHSNNQIVWLSCSFFNISSTAVT